MDAALLAQAENLLELDRDAQARDVVTRLLAQEPDHPRALCLLARACLGTHDAAGAVRAAQAAARVAPHDDWPLRLEALAYSRLGDHAAARQAALRAVEVSPDDWRPHVVFAQVGLPVRSLECEPAARTAVRLDPTNPDCHEVLGDVLLDRGRTREAAAAYRQALHLDPQHAGSRHGMALVHARRRNIGRAAAGFAAAAAADPDDRMAAHNLVVMGTRALQVVHLITWIAMVTGGRAALDTGRGVYAVVGFLAAALALGAFVVVLWWGARPNTWRLARSVLRRQRSLAVWFALLVLTLLLLGLGAVVPPGARAMVLGAATGTLFAATLVVVAMIVGARFGRRRRA
ncbi:tetratricopeptide repeat protein [Jatrophihabitans fulvus]